MLPVSAPLALVPLTAYVGFCCLALFLPHWSWFLPILSHGSRSSRTVALTFDDGPDPRATPALLNLLQKRGHKATFFILGHRAARHPELVDAILKAGHSVGNHSFSHDKWLMLRSSKRLSADIAATQKLLAGHGVRPLAFRPPVGITNPLLDAVLSRLDLFAVNFSCRGYDLGNRRLTNLAAKLLGRVRGGDILLLHDTSPPRTEDLKLWIDEVERLLTGLTQKGLAVVPLEDLIGRKVMVSVEKDANLIRSFSEATYG
jgi:peptidoglycan/xylan/chitin deacetylase (PgdA/CDA1 family)